MDNLTTLTHWKAVYYPALEQLKRLNEQNVDLKLAPTAKSTGYVARHIIEVATYIARNYLNAEVPMPNPVLTMRPGSADFHQDPAELLALWEAADKAIRAGIAAQTPESWGELVESPWGAFKRANGYTYVVYHTAHHTGQIALTLAYAKV